MADKGYKIPISVDLSTTGAAEADAAVQKIRKTGEAIQANTPVILASHGHIGKMGQLANQASYQIQDFAVQVSMGTSTLTAFSQQAPQMLGSLSAAGVLSAKAALGLGAAGAAIPILTIAGREFFRWLDNDAKKSTRDMGKEFEELSKKAGELAGKKNVAALKEWVQTLDDETQKYKEQNTALADQLDLINVRRQAQMSMESAQREAEIAAIQADEKKPEADKIREIAAIREKDLAAQTMAKAADLHHATQLAQKESENATTVRTKAQAAKDATAAKVAELETEKKAIEARERASKTASASAAAIQKQMAEVKAQMDAETALSGEAGPNMEVIASAEARLAKLSADLEKTNRAAGGFSRSDKSRLGSIDKEIDAARAADEEKKRTLDDRATAEADAKRKADKTAEIERIRTASLGPEYAAKRSARASQTLSAVREAERRAEEQAERERAEAARAAMETARGKLQGSSKAKSAEIFSRSKGRNPKDPSIAMASRVAGALEDGTDSRELAGLQREVSANVNHASAAMVDFMKQVLSELAKLSSTVEQQAGQLKNSRSGK